MALLFHDIEKPNSIQIRDDGNFSYIGHERKSAEYAKKWLIEYETPYKIINTVYDLIDSHMKKDMKVSTMVSNLGIEKSKMLIDVLEADAKGRNFELKDDLISIANKRLELDTYKIKSSTPMDENKPTIIILIGLPRSGKSSFYKKYFDKYEYLSRDEIRERLFGFKGNMDNEETVTRVFNEMLNDALNKSKNIIIDNTNVQTKYRIKYLSMAKARKYNTKAYLINTEYDTVIKNAKKENFPIEVIESMLCRLNKPLYEEGYNEIYNVKTEFLENEIKYEMELV